MTRYSNKPGSDSGIVSRLAAEVRGYQQFRDAGGEEVEPPEGVSVESIMLTKVPVRETVEQDAIEALSEALHGPNLNEPETMEENMQEDCHGITQEVCSFKGCRKNKYIIMCLKSNMKCNKMSRSLKK